MKITGKVSHFGGPADTGVTSSEDLAFWEEYSQVHDPERIFLPAQPAGTTGLARRLDPDKFYVACRWPYEKYPKSELASGEHVAMVRAPKTGKYSVAWPADWGPNEDTGRVADISPGLMEALGITTDDTVEVTYPFGEEEEQPVTYSTIALSAGHGKKIAGASGYFEENVETPVIMRRVAQELRVRGIKVYEFWDQTSTSVSANLDTIVDWHNSLVRDLDVSFHFNASNGQGHGVEVLFVTQEDLAAKVSAAIAQTGLTNRGAKYRTDLAFLNNTDKPAILIETCFCDNLNDSTLYDVKFPEICFQIAEGLVDSGGVARPPVERPEPPDPPDSPDTSKPVVSVAMTVPEGVDIALMINGERIFLGDESD